MKLSQLKEHINKMIKLDETLTKETAFVVLLNYLSRKENLTASILKLNIIVCEHLDKHFNNREEFNNTDDILGQYYIKEILGEKIDKSKNVLPEENKKGGITHICFNNIRTGKDIVNLLKNNNDIIVSGIARTKYEYNISLLNCSLNNVLNRCRLIYLNNNNNNVLNNDPIWNSSNNWRKL
jgi:hypothetical protein